MAEYIDREKVREEVCKGCTHRTGNDGCGFPEPCEKLLAELVAVEPADVAPVVHSKWIFNDEWWEFRCTNCQGPIGNVKKYNYCPHCGAKMDGGEKDAEVQA